MEKLSLGENGTGRLFGHLVRRVGVFVVIVWVAAGLALKFDLLMLVGTSMVFVLFVEGMRSFLLGKILWVGGGSIPAEPGRTGIRLIMFLLSVAVVGVAMYIMVAEVFKGVQ